MTRNRTCLILLLALLLGACASQRISQPVELSRFPSEAAIPETELLDITSVLSEGIRERRLEEQYGDVPAAEFSTRTVTLSGTIEEQYEQWRAILAEMHALEQPR